MGAPIGAYFFTANSNLSQPLKTSKFRTSRIGFSNVIEQLFNNYRTALLGENCYGILVGTFKQFYFLSS